MKKLNYLAGFVLLWALLMMVYFIYVLTYPFKPLIVHNTKIETPIVKAGDNVVYVVDYCRVGNYPASVARTFVGQGTIPTPIVNTVTKAGCGIARIPLKIPTGTEPGVYHLEIIAEFKLSPIRTINYQFHTDNFEVK